MTTYDAIFKQAAAKHGVPQTLLESIARTESSLNPNVDPNPPTDGVGLMQVTESTARGLGYTGTRNGLKDPATNVDLGAKYSRQIIDRQKGLNLVTFYSEYNSGRMDLWRTSTQVRQHIENFLRNFAIAVGQPFDKLFPVGASLEAIAAIPAETWTPLMMVLVMILLVRK